MTFQIERNIIRKISLLFMKIFFNTDKNIILTNRLNHLWLYLFNRSFELQMAFPIIFNILIISYLSAY